MNAAAAVASTTVLLTGNLTRDSAAVPIVASGPEIASSTFAFVSILAMVASPRLISSLSRVALSTLSVAIPGTMSPSPSRIP